MPAAPAGSVKTKRRIGPGRPRGPWRRFVRRVGDSPVVWSVIGRLGAGYFRFVKASGRVVMEPADPYPLLDVYQPAIVTAWHGHHFMTPVFWPAGYPLKALISNSRDGELNAQVAHRFGIGTIRGSGGRSQRRTLKKGGIRGFLQMKAALEEGCNIFMTADISNGAARRCGEGIVALARASGRPIVAIGVATAPRLEFDSWDRSRLGLPFGRTACVVGEPILVPADADDALLEQKRLDVEASLNTVTDRAYALVDRRRG